jgi:hypothetical protein
VEQIVIKQKQLQKHSLNGLKRLFKRSFFFVLYIIKRFNDVILFLFVVE